GPWSLRPQSLVAAMIDPKLEVFPYNPVDNPKAIRYLSEEEFERLADADPDARKWQKGMAVTRADQPLLVDGNRAVQFGLANRTVEHFAQFKRHYDLQDDPALVEPGWADFLIEALASPGVGALLLTIAFVAMYAELHAPGIGIGGFTAAVCFLLYFWSHHLGGTAGWLEIILFVAGVSCLLLEVFVLPGFGIFGLGGGCLVLASVILATQTFVVPHNTYQYAQLQRSLLSIAGAGIGVVAATLLLRRWLPQTPIFNRLFLNPPAGDKARQISRRETLIDLGGIDPEDFIGAEGTATTQLTPGGKARFGDMLVDVITDGDVVARGTRIEVVELQGNRVVVRGKEKEG
ncbi:MAG: NfeD family protein, partial [Thermoguttaceae bacterium]